MATRDRSKRICKNEIGGLVGVLNADDFERLARIKNRGRHCEWKSRMLQSVRNELGVLIHGDQEGLVFMRFQSLVSG